MDLDVAILYATLITTMTLILGVGNLAAIPMVLLVPGYVLTALVFPRDGEITWIERLAMSAGLSILSVPLISLSLSLMAFGTETIAVTGATGLFTILVGLAARIRRVKLEPNHRLSLAILLTVPDWSEHDSADKAITLALVATVILAGGAVVYFVATPWSPDRFTEFYILGPTGNESGYPTSLGISQTGSVVIGIVNHETTSVDYTLRVDLVGVEVIYNTTAHANETLEMNRTGLSSFLVPLDDGRNWTRIYSFSIPAAGHWEVQFLLFKDGDFASAYRELHLFVLVS